MATRVEQLPGVGGRTPHDAYPWGQWLNGDAWHLSRGSDYAVATTAIRAYAYRAARAAGCIVRTVRDRDGEGITLQAFDPPADPDSTEA